MGLALLSWVDLVVPRVVFEVMTPLLIIWFWRVVLSISIRMLLLIFPDPSGFWIIAAILLSYSQSAGS